MKASIKCADCEVEAVDAIYGLKCPICKCMVVNLPSGGSIITEGGNITIKGSDA